MCGLLTSKTSFTIIKGPQNPSPVLRDKSGPLQALPGNVFGSFSTWKHTDAPNGLEQQALKVVRKFDLPVSTLEVCAQAKLARVELANSLQGVATCLTARPKCLDALGKALLGSKAPQDPKTQPSTSLRHKAG